MPVVKEKESDSRIVELSNADVETMQERLGFIETSWDFAKHPLVRLKDSMKFTDTDGDRKNRILFLAGCISCMENECEEHFAQLKANEEENEPYLHRHLRLAGRAYSGSRDKDVTVRKADLQRDVRSLISYAVGCMFGRYSLDVEGLAYAGDEWDASKFTTYPADKDNIIPICDEEYFDDDMVSRFVKFIETVYGSDTLEENLKLSLMLWVEKVSRERSSAIIS